MHKIKILFLIVLAYFTAACATTPIPASSASPVPNNRLLAFQQADISNHATFIVTRDVGSVNSLCYNGFLINGKLAARIGTGETATFYVPPGETLLRAGYDPQGGGLCGLGKDNWTQRETIAKSGDTKYFRISLSAEAIPDIQRTK